MCSPEGSVTEDADLEVIHRLLIPSRQEPCHRWRWVMRIPTDLELANCKHTGYGDGVCPNLLVRNVPDGIHSTLVRRAGAEGKSLQEYVLSLLTESAEQPTMAEVMAEIDATLGAHPIPSLSTEEALATIRALRDA